MPGKALDIINSTLTQFTNERNFKATDYLFLKGTILKNSSKLDQA